MQNDTWLTDISHPDCCPLCSQPLVGGASTCPACGFTVRAPARASAFATDKPASRRANPATPIPARASAQRVQHSIGGSSHRPAHSLSPDSSVEHSPEQGWQHESPSYEAVSSLSALSLILAETPTKPPRATRHLSDQTGDLEYIDEIDTVPQISSEPQSASTNPIETPFPPSLPDGSFATFQQIRPASYLVPTLFPAFDEIDTLPEPGALAIRDAQPMPPVISKIAVGAASWSADPDSTGARNPRLVTPRPQRRRFRHFTLLDRARWWLVRPGHIESLFRLVGLLFLFALTFLIAFFVVLNLPLTGRGNFPNSATPVSAGIPTAPPSSVSQPASTSTVHPGSAPTASPVASVTVGTPEATVAATQQNSTDSPASAHSSGPTNLLLMQLAHPDPLTWIIGLCYTLSFFLLGMAAILRRRR